MLYDAAEGEGQSVSGSCKIVVLYAKEAVAWAMSGRGKALGSLNLFLLLVVGGGLAIGFLTAPGHWYAELAKPSFNPPNWLFGPVWTVLYVLIAVAGWRTYELDRGAARLMKLWWVQLMPNFLWSPIFFAIHQIGLAFLVISLLLVAILVFIIISWRWDRVAASLFAAYAGWVAFASVLNGTIWLLN